MHDGQRAEAVCQLASGREVIGVRVRVDDEANAQRVARRQRQVAVDLTDLGIDHRPGARVGTAQQVRLATTGGNPFEDHDCFPTCLAVICIKSSTRRIALWVVSAMESGAVSLMRKDITAPFSASGLAIAARKN